MLKHLAPPAPPDASASIASARLDSGPVEAARACVVAHAKRRTARKRAAFARDILGTGYVEERRGEWRVFGFPMMTVGR